MKSPVYALAITGAIMVTIVFFTLYAVVQQDIRQSANDPQIGLTEDGVYILDQGVPPHALITQTTSDASQSTSPFVMIYDASGALLRSTATIGNAPPVLPQGIFDFVRAHGEDRVTWQTPSGFRYALVIAPWKTASSSGFFAAARSLRDIEVRERSLEIIVAFSWVVSLVVILIAGLSSVRKYP